MKKLSKQFLTVLFFLVMVIAMSLGACDIRPKTSSSENGGGQHVEHTESDWIVDMEPTCTESGLRHKECIDCGKTLGTEVFPAIGHTVGEWVTDVLATCTENGSKHRECSVCHITLDADVIPAIGHDLVWHEAKNATCTENGWEAYDTCTRCDYTTYTEITALGHNYVDGTCTRCGAADPDYTPPTPHEHISSEWIIDKAATCTEKGSRHKKCTVCGEVLESAIIPIKQHNFETKSYTLATCTEDGKIEYECSGCGLKKVQIIISNGHYFGYDNICDKCGYEMPIHEHEYNETVVDPTCTQVGYTRYECSCGLSYKADYVEQKGHLWNDGSVTKEAACTTDGSIKYSCTREGCTAKRTETIPAGHDWSETIITDRTCETDGKISRKCNRCGVTERKTIPAGHEWGAPQVITPAICAKDGVERVTCKACGATEDRAIKAGHEYKNGVCVRCGAKFIDDVTPEPEHPTYGMFFVIDDIQSNYGSEIINEYGVMLYVNADAQLEKVAVHLTQDGYMWRRTIACTGTNIKFAVYVPYLSYGEEIYYTGLNSPWINTFALTEGADGIWRYSEYATIGVNLEDKDGNLLLSLYDIGQAGSKTRIFDNLEEMKAWLKGYDVDHTHIEVIDPTIDTDCTHGGYTQGSHCSVCGEIIVARKYIPANGHKFGEWTVTKNPTCETAGERTAYCANCNKTITAGIPALGHNIKAISQKNVTCTEPGYIEYGCTRTGCTYTYRVATYASHEYEVSGRQAATCTEDGYIEYSCKNCTDSYKEIIPKGNHDYELTAEQAPTTQSAGYKEYTCKNCNDSYRVEIPRLKSDTTGRVLLIEDRLPWTERANATVLNNLLNGGYITGWNMITTAQIATTDFDSYDLIIIANDQTSATYNVIKANAEKIADFAYSGGAVIYGSCDHGWAAGQISYTLPGGVGKTNYYSNYNYIVDNNSPVVTAELTDGNGLTDALLYGTYCSHTTFTGLPANAKVILVDGKGNPSLAEYDYGDGYVMLSGLTWEYSYVRNLVANGSFAKSVFDDMIVYALSKTGENCAHKFDGGNVFAPSCIEFGYTLYTCAVCGKVVKKDFVEPFGHDFGEWEVVKESTCTENGLERINCTRTGCDYFEESEIYPLGHKVSDWIVDLEPTCSEKGSRHKECTVCGTEVEVEEISALGHDLVRHEAKNATCTEIGWEAYETCTRCDYSTYAEIPALGHSYVDGTCTRCGAKDPNYTEPTPSAGTYRIEGNYIYFGTYPQTDVTASMGTTLASYVSDLPSNGNNNGWTSYNYYRSNSNETDFMWYKDVTYSDGNKYRAVYFTSYRPSRTTNSGSPFWQDDNGYKTNNVYWFRFDEIKWKILEKAGNTATILAELILDSQDYNHTENNNYENSSIRAWLNDTFYNTAFNSLQKALINTVEVDNSARSTNPDNDSTKWNRGTNKYACANTQDKVWLLSQQDVTRVAYGFNSDPYNYDMARRKQTTAYAQSQGIWKSAEIDYRGNGCWWLRSPFYYFSYDAQIVNFTGYSASINLDIIAISTHRGVVPALQMTLSNEEHKHTESEWIVDEPATCTLPGSMHKECAECGETIDAVEISALGHNYVNGECSRCGAADPDYTPPTPSDETYRIEGDYIYFGRYPQTDVTASMGTTLTSYVSAKPANDNNNGWTSYKYYISSSNTNDYMRYKDVTYTDGNKYRAVYFTSYRPCVTSYSSSTGNTRQDDNGYTVRNVYWFRFDEIKWRILNRTGNTATILAELILDSQDYNYTCNSTNGYYANNYANSSIRKWLNDTFYNTAFNDLQKALINTVTVDNSARSTNPDNDATYWNSGTNKYACENTQDKVWLLSQQEVTRASYGFNTLLGTGDTIRRKQTTGYAQCQGAYTITSTDYRGNGWWWLRSPDCNYVNYAYGVYYAGSVYNYYDYGVVDYTSYGVVPALQISLG